VALSPLILYSLRWLREGGIRRATICANRSSSPSSRLGDGTAHDMELSHYRDETPRGAAGCLRDAGVAAGSDTVVASTAPRSHADLGSCWQRTARRGRP